MLSNEVEVKDYTNLEGKVVALSIWDDFGGLAEFKKDEGENIRIQWINGTPCYSCVYCEAVYTQDSLYSKKDICEIEECVPYSKGEIKALRNESLNQDKDIFKMYKDMIV